MGKRLIVALSLGLALAAACGDDDGGKSDGGGSSDGGPKSDAAINGGMDATTGPDGSVDGAVVGPDGTVIGPDGMVVVPGSKTTKITSAGGQAKSADGVVTIDFPAGVFLRPTDITIRPVQTALPGALGMSYEVLPTTEPLNILGEKQVIVTFTYPASAVGSGGPTALQLGVFEGGGWSELVRPNAYAFPMGAIRGALPRLGPVGLFTGICLGCSEFCDPGTCKFPAGAASGVPGKCVPFGKGCGHCVPTCDSDGDGYCQGTPGSEQKGGDCQPNDAKIHPDALEICNGIDDDCDSFTDEGCKSCKADADCTGGNEWCDNGFCVPCYLSCTEGAAGNCSQYAGGTMVPGKCFMRTAACNDCVPSCDGDGDRYCAAGSPQVGQQGDPDCDDTKIGVHPSAPEVCGNGIDDDCNGFIDDNCKECSKDTDCPSHTACVGGACVGCTSTCAADNCRFPAGASMDAGVAGECRPFGNECNRCTPSCDGDGDGYCRQGQGDLPGGDCNDSDPNVHGGTNAAPEVCGDNVDNNCDGNTDEGCQGCTADDQCSRQWYCANGACKPCDTGYDPTTCLWPREAAADAGMPGGRFVYGSAGSCVKCLAPCDKDGDEYCPAGSLALGQREGVDCDDTNATINPSAIEVCGNGKDDDCKDGADELCTTCAEAAMCGDAQSCSSR